MSNEQISIELVIHEYRKWVSREGLILYTTRVRNSTPILLPRQITEFKRRKACTESDAYGLLILTVFGTVLDADIFDLRLIKYL